MSDIVQNPLRFGIPLPRHLQVPIALPVSAETRSGNPLPPRACARRAAVVRKENSVPMAVITVTADPPVDPQTPTTTHYQQLAADFMNALDQIAAIIPQVEQAEAGTKLVRAHLNVPDVFCSTAIIAVEQVPELLGTRKLDPVAGRIKMQFLEAFRPMSDKAGTLVKRLDYTLMWLKATLAEDSLQMYRIAKSIASDKRSPLVQAHVENLKRDLGRKGLTKAQREERKAAKLKAAAEAFALVKEVKPAA